MSKICKERRWDGEGAKIRKWGRELNPLAPIFMPTRRLERGNY